MSGRMTPYERKEAADIARAVLISTPGVVQNSSVHTSMVSTANSLSINPTILPVSDTIENCTDSTKITPTPASEIQTFTVIENNFFGMPGHADPPPQPQPQPSVVLADSEDERATVLINENASSRSTRRSQAPFSVVIPPLKEPADDELSTLSDDSLDLLSSKSKPERKAKSEPKPKSKPAPKQRNNKKAARVSQEDDHDDSFEPNLNSVRDIEMQQDNDDSDFDTTAKPKKRKPPQKPKKQPVRKKTTRGKKAPEMIPETQFGEQASSLTDLSNPPSNELDNSSSVLPPAEEESVKQVSPSIDSRIETTEPEPSSALSSTISRPSKRRRLTTQERMRLVMEAAEEETAENILPPMEKTNETQSSAGNAPTSPTKTTQSTEKENIPSSPEKNGFSTPLHKPKVTKAMPSPAPSSTSKRKGLASLLERQGIKGIHKPGLSHRHKIPHLHANLKPPPPKPPPLPQAKKKKKEDSDSDDDKPWYEKKPVEEWDSDDREEWSKVQRQKDNGNW